MMIDRSQKLAKWQLIVGIPLAILMFYALYLVFLNVPTEKTMGIVQRIFYFHVPAAIASFVAFFVVAGFSLAFLLKRNRLYDRVSYVAAEIGVLFATMCLISGSIWARPIWNTWWSWDARLTTTLILWLIYVGYLMLREYAGEDERGARFSAVFAIIGVLDIPIVYFSIRWWRTLHPKPVIAGGEGSGLAPAMAYAFQISMLVFMLLFVFLLITRLRVELANEELKEIKRTRALAE